MSSCCCNLCNHQQQQLPPLLLLPLLLLLLLQLQWQLLLLLLLPWHLENPTPDNKLLHHPDNYRHFLPEPEHIAFVHNVVAVAVVSVVAGDVAPDDGNVVVVVTEREGEK